MDKTALGSVLVVDDNERLFKSLAINLQKNGFASDWAGDGLNAEKKIESTPYAAVFLDLALGEENGIDVLPRLLRIRPETPVIIITGYGTFDAAVKATKLGAYDFLPKPLDIDKLMDVLREATRTAPASTGDEFSELHGMVTRSANMRHIFAQTRLVADSNLPVLITGESGTGKELMARFVHLNSLRREKTFLSVNCSAIADSLADSELFGHEKGAFTGAASERTGVFEQANGGTLHLDEIGDMTMGIQAKILRVLEEAKVRRVGDSRDLPIDVRLIASTNKDLKDCIAQGTFRHDLFYRLNAVHLHLPPLRERPGDIPILLDYYLGKIAEKGVVKRFSDTATDMLVHYDWPGNIRELRNLVKMSALVSPGKIIEIDDIPEHLQEGSGKGGKTRKSVRLSDNERELIRQALDEAGGNKQKAARRLGISRRTLYNKLERYGLS